jgi:hypothetical protein
MFFFHMRTDISHIFNLRIIAIMSNGQVKEARSCYGILIGRYSLEHSPEKNFIVTIINSCYKCVLYLLERIFCSREIRNHLPKITFFLIECNV